MRLPEEQPWKETEDSKRHLRELQGDLVWTPGIKLPLKI